jgi:hypothetical protein
VDSSARRRLVALAVLLPASLRSRAGNDAMGGLVVHTFGDSILDCARYNPHGVHPGQLLVKNDDRLFPEFRGRDLQSRCPARLQHHAVDGATVDSLAAQARSLGPLDAQSMHLALLTIGGNDLIRGLAGDTGVGMKRFEQTLAAFLERLPIRRVLLGTVYDPTFGDDARNFLSVAPGVTRGNLQRVNRIISDLGASHGGVADLHAHFLGGEPGWFTGMIEPSLIGASEVRRVFLQAIDSGR